MGWPEFWLVLRASCFLGSGDLGNLALSHDHSFLSILVLCGAIIRSSPSIVPWDENFYLL